MLYNHSFHPLLVGLSAQPIWKTKAELTRALEPRYSSTRNWHVYTEKDVCQNAHSGNVENSQQMHIHKCSLTKERGKLQKNTEIKIKELPLHIIS